MPNISCIFNTVFSTHTSEQSIIKVLTFEEGGEVTLYILMVIQGRHLEPDYVLLLVFFLQNSNVLCLKSGPSNLQICYSFHTAQSKKVVRDRTAQCFKFISQNVLCFRVQTECKLVYKSLKQNCLSPKLSNSCLPLHPSA